MIEFPEHVIQTANDLKKANDPRLVTIQKLMQPRKIDENDENWDSKRDYPVLDDYQRMWRSIERKEKKLKGELLDNEWVLDFLDDIIAAQKLPKYMYMQDEKRLELINNINALTKELGKIFEENTTDVSLCLKKATSRKKLKLHRKSNTMDLLDYGQISRIDMTQTLKQYTRSLIIEIASTESLTKDSKGIEERMFAVALVKRNNFLYSLPLNEVVALCIWAIYGRNNAPSTIRNIVRRSQEF